MKMILFRTFLFIAFFSFGTYSYAQVGIGTTMPDASSMLEVQSTTKGVLIPRMTALQRTSISSPAKGLLVFDLDSESFWFYSTSWEELVANNTLVDADNDTKIEVEKNADEDIIRMTTAGSERLRIDEFGNTRIGNGTDNTFIEADGSLSFEGAATRYEDLTIPVTSTKAGGSKEPNFAVLETNGSSSQGVFTYWFEGSNEKELYFTVQIPHGRKYDTEIFPHVHWSPETDLGANNVVWGLEYNWANLGETLGATNIIYGSSVNSLIGGPANAKKHLITAFTGLGINGGIDGTGKTLSSMLLCRIFRATGHAQDNFSGNAGLLQIDFHLEFDAEGSRELYTK